MDRRRHVPYDLPRKVRPAYEGERAVPGLAMSIRSTSPMSGTASGKRLRKWARLPAGWQGSRACAFLARKRCLPPVASPMNRERRLGAYDMRVHGRSLLRDHAAHCPYTPGALADLPQGAVRATVSDVPRTRQRRSGDGDAAVLDWLNWHEQATARFATPATDIDLF